MSRPPLVGEPARAGSVAEDIHPYYLRLELKDSPGVLSEVSGVFGTHGISLRVVEQHDSSEGAARVVFLTYPTTHGALRAAVAELDGHSVVVRTGQVLRIFGT
jgi:homoserine dehydrogenase